MAEKYYALNEQGFITSVTDLEFPQPTQPTFDFPAGFDFGEMQYYRIVDGALVYAAENKAADELAVQLSEELALLKAQLAATDYAVIKIAEGAATAEEYAATIASRQAWRARINEIEQQANTL